jgi:RNA polymerase sigma factor (TIGR02999 family)
MGAGRVKVSDRSPDLSSPSSSGGFLAVELSFSQWWRARFTEAGRGDFPVNQASPEIPEVIDVIGARDARTGEELLPLVYEELRRLAAAQLAREAPGQTLQATALVHEAWLRLGGAGGYKWEGENHFFGAAAQAMRRILIDNARRKQCPKHGGGRDRIELEKIELAQPMPSDDLLALDEALTVLAQRDPQAGELVQLRFFAGLTQEQAAAVLGVSRRTADRTWAYARAWLFQQLAGNRKPGS